MFLLSILIRLVTVLCITVSFSIGNCLALETLSTVTSTQAAETTRSKDTNPVSEQEPSAAPPATASQGEKTGSCPVFLLLSADGGEETLLIRFRDIVLAENERGIDYTRLYDIQSPEITFLLLTDNAIKVHAQQILYDMLPIIASHLTKGEASIPQTLLDDMDSLINEIARSASPALKDALRMAKSDLIKKPIFEELKIRIIQ